MKDINDKSVPTTLRMFESDIKKLQIMADATVRTKSDMIRFLIQSEYARNFQKQPTQAATNETH